MPTWIETDRVVKLWPESALPCRPPALDEGAARPVVLEQSGGAKFTGFKWVRFRSRFEGAL
jgi:hypothetical protein